MMKIESNLGRMCQEMALDDSITESYRDQLAASKSVKGYLVTKEETKQAKLKQKCNRNL